MVKHVCIRANVCVCVRARASVCARACVCACVSVARHTLSSLILYPDHPLSCLLHLLLPPLPHSPPPLSTTPGVSGQFFEGGTSSSKYRRFATSASRWRRGNSGNDLDFRSARRRALSGESSDEDLLTPRGREGEEGKPNRAFMRSASAQASIMHYVPGSEGGGRGIWGWRVGTEDAERERERGEDEGEKESAELAMWRERLESSLRDEEERGGGRRGGGQ